MSAEFRILGPVEALRDGEPVDLGPRRQRLVLVRLLLDAGRPVAVDRVIEDVWGGAPPEGARRTLRSYLSRLRGALGDAAAIAATPAGYVLEATAEAIDAERFARLAEEGRDLLRRRNPRAAAARLAEALGLWRGMALAGVPPEPFVVAEADRLEQLRIGAVEDHVDAELDLGRHTELVPRLEQLVREHPLRERLWVHLLTALYHAGRQADALEAYRSAARLLDEELGIEPGEELRSVHLAVLRQDLRAPEAPPASNLPVPLTAFVGREREVADLSALVGSDRLVTLTGVGGAGKTRLAVEVARGVVDRFADGTWMVDLAPVGDPALVAGAVAAAAGIVDRAGRPATVVLREHLAAARVLLLLDNCEHVVEACAALAQELLQSCPELHLLATSREALGVPGEVRWEVAPLRPPAPGEDPLAAPAVQLFLDRAATPVPAEDLDAVGRICRELDGLPLAIEIAAAQTRVLGAEEIAERLADRFRLLAHWSRTAVPRHSTLRASLDWSYALLDADARALLHRLGVFAGGFTLAAAEAVVADPSAVQEDLRRLVDASLVVREPSQAPPRFRMLVTVRQYAWERAVAVGDADDAARRHAGFYAGLAERALAAVDTPEQGAVHAQVDRELADVRAALGWALQASDDDLLVRLARGMGLFWSLRGHLEEGATWLRLAIERATGAPDQVRADLLGELGRVEVVRNRFDDARSLLEEAVAVGQVAGTPLLPRWVHLAAYVARMQGRLGQARAVLEAAVEQALARGDRTSASHHTGSLAEIAFTQGRLQDAATLFDRALGLVHPAPPSLRLAYLDSTARLQVARGEDEDGWRRAAEGLELARQLGDHKHVAFTLTTLAHVALRRAQHGQAAVLLDEALEVAWQLGELSVAAEALDAVGGLLLEGGDPAVAATALAAADDLRARAGVPRDAHGTRLRPGDRAAVAAALAPASGAAAAPDGMAVDQRIGVVQRALRRIIERQQADDPARLPR